MKSVLLMGYFVRYRTAVILIYCTPTNKLVEF